MKIAASEAHNNEADLIRRLYLFAILISLITTLLPACGYLWITYQSQKEGMLVESKLYSAFITQYIRAKQNGWQKDVQLLIEEELTPAELPENRTIFDESGKLLAGTGNTLSWPSITLEISLPGHDSRNTGSIRIERSLEPVIFTMVQIALGSATIGIAIFLVVYILPMRALNRTLLALAREKSQAMEQKEKLQAVIENANEGIITINENLEVETFNRAAEKIFGYTARAATGMHAYTIIPAFSTDHKERHETTGYSMDGHAFPIEVTLNTIHIHDTSKTVCLVHDITRRKQVENELTMHRNHLQELINQQTADLLVAKDTAESASRAKSDFLSTMSHEIRTPINAILGMTYLALKTRLTDKQKDYLGKSYQSAQHLLHIVNEILDFSKIEKGKLQIESVYFRTRDLLNNLSSIIGDSALRKGLKLTIEAESIPPVLRGDPLRLGQILINLASNAIKFTDKGEVSIRFLAEHGLNNQMILRCEIRDTGIGISDEVRVRLFQPFLQADSSVSRKYGGTGLGLTISQLLVKLMQGKMGVESTAGQGSTFWIVIPVGIGSESCLPAEKGYLSHVSTTILKGVRILLAEDNLFNQEIAAEILQNAGAIVCVASNGVEAIDMLNKEHFDLVMMDIQMPEMDGLEAARIIRNNPALEFIPIIALTANASNEDRDICLAAGMDDFITKPIQPDQLASIVARLIAQDRITKGEPA